MIYVCGEGMDNPVEGSLEREGACGSVSPRRVLTILS